MPSEGLLGYAAEVLIIIPKRGQNVCWAALPIPWGVELCSRTLQFQWAMGEEEDINSQPAALQAMRCADAACDPVVFGSFQKITLLERHTNWVELEPHALQT